MSKDRIGLIGVGLMGHGIARNILNAGYSLTFLSHPGNQPTQDLQEYGAKPALTPANVAANSDIVILCVTGSPEVTAVLNGPDGVISALDDAKTVIDCSTTIPEESIKNEAAIATKGAAFLDAPMTRTPKEAAEGRLNLIVGGDKAVFDRCLAAMQSFAEHIHHVGPVGSGNAVKLLHNFVSLGYASVLAEAAACAKGRGIDTEQFLKVLSEGGGGGVVLDRLSPFIRDADDSGLRFTIANALKDMTYYTEMAKSQGASADIAGVVRQIFANNLETGGPTATVPQLIDLLSKTE